MVSISIAHGILRLSLFLSLVLASVLGGPVPVTKEAHRPDSSARDTNLARRSGGFARIAKHVTNSMRLGSGYLKQHSPAAPTGKPSRPAYFGAVPVYTDPKLKVTPVENPKVTPVENPKVTPVENPKVAPVKKLKVAPVKKPKVVPVEKPKATSAEKPKDTPAEKLKITPGELNHYAKAANQHLGLDSTHDHIMGAAHKEGSDTVHFHSIPRGPDLLKHLNNGGTHPELEAKMKEGPNAQVHANGALAHHAETAAVNQGMIAENSETTEGWSVGQHGHYKEGNPVQEPCQGKCQQTFQKANIAYQNKDGQVVKGHPEPQGTHTTKT